jgi:hypothetical protein
MLPQWHDIAIIFIGLGQELGLRMKTGVGASIGRLQFL